MFSSLSPCKNFSIPSWILSLRKPDHPFPLMPPSYEKITSVIRRMNSSATPCPRDKISIIVFKRCQYLRSFITNIIHNIWLSGKVPLEWKKACTILIHKKSSNSDPANFRHITLEPVLWKSSHHACVTVYSIFLKLMVSLSTKYKKASPRIFQGP